MRSQRNFLALLNKTFAFLMFSTLCFSLTTFAQPGGSTTGEINSPGNGGDTIRRQFIEMGYEAIEWARHSPELLTQLPHGERDLLTLQSFLSIAYLKVVKQDLYDNGKSKVQALGVPRLLISSLDSIHKA